MEYKVVIGALFIDDVKYRRGDTVKLSEEKAAKYGVRLEVLPKKTRKKATDEDS